MEINWFVYCIFPIDFGWENLQTVKGVLVKLASSDAILIDHDINEALVQEFINKWSSAKSAALKKGWEGDFRNEPRVFWLPSEESFECAFVFKQDNNGTTIVVSPKPLPWLDRLTELQA